jgi:hypothetical protein
MALLPKPTGCVRWVGVTEGGGRKGGAKPRTRGHAVFILDPLSFILPFPLPPSAFNSPFRGPSGPSAGWSPAPA